MISAIITPNMFLPDFVYDLRISTGTESQVLIGTDSIKMLVWDQYCIRPHIIDGLQLDDQLARRSSMLGQLNLITPSPLRYH